MSHVDTILRHILAEPGLTDRQLSQRTGITPVQQINSICRRLAATGMIRRIDGAEGTVINVPTGPPAPVGMASPARVQRHRPKKEPIDDTAAWNQLRRLDPARTLIVLPCSKGKRSGGGSTNGHTITDALSDTLAMELTAARARVAPRVHLDTSALCPAWLRYTGTFYSAAYDALQDATKCGAHVVILSGGYGLVEATEPIWDYDGAMRMGWWPNDILGRCLITYAQRHDLMTMVAFLASCTDYAKVVRRTSWSTHGIGPAILVSPAFAGEGSAQTVVPRAAGEAFSAFWRHHLTPDWASTDGLTLNLEALS